MLRLVSMRTLTVVVSVAVLLGATLAVLGAMFLGWRFGLRTNDSIVVVNTVATVAAFALVALGGILALVAYLNASGTPDLYPEIQFKFSLVNEPVFHAQTSTKSGGRMTVLPFNQTSASVIIRNDSSYAARNPGMRIELDGLGGLTVAQMDGWHVLNMANMIGVTSFQWDGGADEPIHGKWSRTLPPLDFTELTEYREPYLIVTITADGITPRRWKFPVKLLTGVEYGKYLKGLNSPMLMIATPEPETTGGFD